MNIVVIKCSGRLRSCTSRYICIHAYLHSYTHTCKCNHTCMHVQLCMRCKTHKTRGVVISEGLGISERFQHGVGLDDLVLQCPSVSSLVGRIGGNVSKVLDDLLRVLCLACSGLTAEVEDRLTRETKKQ